jgi:thiamine pyrophosphate-dependent acetolactate synthase large subunit-like protein
MAKVTAVRLGLDRRWAIGELLKHRGDCLLVSGLGSSTYDVFAAGDSKANMYLWGAMGGAAMVGLGLALAQPSRKVLVVTGDGELLMGLGALATIAVAGASNLTIIVLDNGYYLETGGQESHSGMGVDLASVAEAIGLEVVSVKSEDELRSFGPRLAEAKASPRFVRVHISTESADGVLPPRDGVYLKLRFRKHLGLEPS